MKGLSAVLFAVSHLFISMSFAQPLGKGDAMVEQLDKAAEEIDACVSRIEELFKRPGMPLNQQVLIGNVSSSSTVVLERLSNLSGVVGLIDAMVDETDRTRVRRRADRVRNLLVKAADRTAGAMTDILPLIKHPALNDEVRRYQDLNMRLSKRLTAWQP